MINALPTKTNIPSDDIFDYRFMIAGEKKAGKTAFVANWPNHIIAEFEPGNAKHLVCRAQDINDWQETGQFIALLEANPNYYNTLIIDDVQSCFEYLIRFLRYNVLKYTENDAFKIQDFGIVKEHFARFVDRLTKLNKGLIFTNHTRIYTTEDLKNKQYSELTTTMSNQCKEAIDGIAHFVGIILKDEGGKRHLYIQGTNYLKCGHGFQTHFRHPHTGEELAFIELGKTPKEGFDNFINAFYNLYIPPEKKQIMKPELTNDGQVIPAPLVTKPVPVVRTK